MSRTLDHPDPTLARALRSLDGFLTTPADVGKRVFIPRPEGLMRHFPGKQLHIMPELLLVEEGVNPMDFPAEQHDLRAGEICVMPRGMPHREDKPRTYPFCMLVIMFKPHRVHYHFSTGTRHARICTSQPSGEIETGHAAQITQLIDTLVQIPRSETDWQREAADTLCFSVLVWIGAVLRSGSRKPARYSPRIEQVINLVADNLHDPALGTATLADWVGCTPDYLSTCFHRETGSSLTRYLNRERLHKAQYLLGHSPMLVKEVAGSCGYANPHYFSRVFREHVGCAPHQWRRRTQRRETEG